jgi:hypothetical protein
MTLGGLRTEPDHTQLSDHGSGTPALIGTLSLVGPASGRFMTLTDEQNAGKRDRPGAGEPAARPTSVRSPPKQVRPSAQK